MERSTRYFAAAFVLQLMILDGILTYLGIEVFRVSSEGNPILRYFMLQVGVLPALIWSRIFAFCCLVIYIVCNPQPLVVQTRFLLALSIFMMGISIIPWTVMLTWGIG